MSKSSVRGRREVKVKGLGGKLRHRMVTRYGCKGRGLLVLVIVSNESENTGAGLASFEACYGSRDLDACRQ